MHHRYRVLLEHVADNRGNPLAARYVQFETTNHDDIMTIIDRLKEKSVLPDEEVVAFCVGLKLFSEVATRNRKNVLFAEFWPHFGRFMDRLKQLG